MEIIVLSFIAAAIIIALSAVIYYQNKRIDVTRYDVYDEKLPQGFDGVRIVQISDLHNSSFGKHNVRLIGEIKAAEPDYIFITGDYIDARKVDFKATDFLSQNITEIAPVYFCTGNHERRHAYVLKKLEKSFRKHGVRSLRNSYVYLSRSDSRIRLIGSDDPAFLKRKLDNEEKEELLYERLSHLCSERDYNILLSHKLNYYRIYESSGADLVFSGHAHGGQFRFPSGIPLYTPDEGFFPRYAQGLHKIGNMILIVSRGLGQSIIPFRINNSPELVIVTLHSSTGEN